MLRQLFCNHQRTRCIHGEEINYRTKVRYFRFWMMEIINRQACLDCGKALDRDAICTRTGKDLHVWFGPWTDDMNPIRRKMWERRILKQLRRRQIYIVP